MSLASQVTALAQAIGADIKALFSRALPSGGSAGQVLSKSSSANYAVGWITPAGSPGGASSLVQFNNAGAFDGAANVAVDNGDLLLSYNDIGGYAPTSQDTVKLYTHVIGAPGGKPMAAAVDKSGRGYPLQAAIFRKKVAWWSPQGNATTVPGIVGIAAPTAVGTATGRTVATTNALTRTKRLGYTSTTTAGSLCGHYVNSAQYTVGAVGTELGGFLYNFRFGVSDTTLQSNARAFIGVTSSAAAPTNVDPATLVNCIGIGHTAGDTNWHLYYGGSAAQPRISLDSVFPINTTDLIQLTIWAPPYESGVYVDVTRITSTSRNSYKIYLGPGTPGTTLPSNTTLLGHRAWRCNNTAAALVGIDASDIYFETDW